MRFQFRRDSVIPIRLNETISPAREAFQKQTASMVCSGRNERGEIMLVSVLNLIYRGFLKRALSGIAMQGGRL